MVIALDIGGTNIRIAEVSGVKIKYKKTAKTSQNQKQTIQTILDLISQYKNHSKICVSVAGFEKSGVIAGSPNTSLNGFPLKKILQSKFKSKIYIQNDARCATLAELKLGAGKKFNNFVLLTLGTGIGGGIVINKELYFGQGIAGEVCDMIIEKGKTFEQLASGKAYNNSKNINEVGRYLGIGLANLAFILDPEAIILGGGFSNKKELLPIAQETLNKIFNFQKIPILKAKFPEDGGLIGAALLSKQI